MIQAESTYSRLARVARQHATTGAGGCVSCQKYRETAVGSLGKARLMWGGSCELSTEASKVLFVFFT